MTEIDTRDFLTRLRGEVNKGLRIVHIRSREAYDGLKIKNEIRRLRKKKADATLEMGSAIYRTFKHAGRINEGSILEKCGQINAIEDDVAVCEEKLRLLHENTQKSLGSLKALSKPKTES